MKRRNFITGMAGLARAGVPSLGQEQAKPNIVFFLSDDHGYWDSSVYGSRVVNTPSLDRLAAAGMVFTNTFAGSPTCVPSRAVIMSGLHSARNGSESNHSGMRHGVKTLPSYLKALGYRVAHFGKDHFIPHESYPDLERVPSEIKGGGPLENDLDTAAVERWLSTLDKRGEQPVALIVGCHSPHVFWPPNDGYDASRVELPPTFVDTAETREARTMYYTDITKMDGQLGQVYESVRKHLGRNTAFFYTADNGAQWPFAKWGLYDAGIRLPMIAVWPGVVKPGTRSDAMISFTDFLPTFVELAGGEPPAGLDGRSFASVLRKGSGAGRSEIFAAHSGDRDMNVYPMRCVRTSRFKYIKNLRPELEYTTHIDRAGNRDGKGYWDSWVAKAKNDPKAAAIVHRYHERPAEELYDVQKDPHETANLADRSEHRATLMELRSKVQEWMKQQGDEGKTFGKPRPLKVEQ